MKTSVLKFEFPQNYNSKGVTLIELIIVATIAILLSGFILGHFNPSGQNAKARDNKRLAEAEHLDRAINEYLLNNGVYPGAANTLRTSTTLPAGNSGPLENPQQGWIDADLSANITKLPIDPLNDSSYFYSFMHNDNGYELNVRLEILTEYSTDDGGNDTEVYEIGNNLNII
ncbi:hypothetical protein A3F07_03285 [candidate division WWE3 bacterium RIFCSPHIGHO2_12_FULL_38_15]|uniref:Type II secretion system protein GspG C-terminal domain-containing protein n=1 Tax=candidate division WWE3 bacterium RIFCSPHIGHO2_02_FULL_38_14 TaxID=1802620 RepID=A0A1F4V6G6_UNCKA|nr:MAG: hypothetical protein A2793_03100 [candidate division WWE3 bacterium RIFCSPHIGHO2_01_FULL_38_45]OGC48825.1 MAG: hypothetical protein A3F07_03285 [candidate division WWE3 bacterium RIFCSPHIGHO2_12_FULL_38_15]OGC52781.1 MAG: hypothetical protein A3D91_01975 [candidate division WWE3 bacterium RIFCSPHIGHO2_02_FULL_38_14]OGC53128.1 MAG: hypothetical protein A3B64_01625 [candidate division WWE3 bacterium RIFCSPLOWO2_01_FULL_37_24]HLB51967.1 type II secretion system protein [Patescibacteria gro